MPLFMDFHKIENVTIDAVKMAHSADEAIQDKYGVKYHQFWVNQEAGTVFCLVEGPDAATCELVHQMAHGNLPCALTEVETGFYEKLMGKNHKVDNGYVQHADGTVDLGYRSILFASVYGITTVKSPNDPALLLTPLRARKIIAEKITTNSGREVKWEVDDGLIGVFDDTTDAVRCAIQINEALLQHKKADPPIIFKIGISAAQPVTQDGNFFTEAIRLAHRLSITAADNQVLISPMAKKLCKEEKLLKENHFVGSLSTTQEEFMSKLLNISEANLSDQEFGPDNLSTEICVSRPQLYRKIKALTGRSPNDFIHSLRMARALALLKQKKANIAEVAFETGFNSPSYFTKCFTERFGCTPSLFVKANRA